MNFKILDFIADICNPLLILALIALSASLGSARWSFLMRSGLAVVTTQQLSKFVQKREIWGEHFPSTHFAVALALCVGLVVLKRRFWPFALVYLGAYLALMMAQNYHTPREMLGSLFAVPLALLFHWRPKKAPVATN